MATLVTPPRSGGHDGGLIELDHLLADLYVVNNEESRLIEKEKQHIAALEAGIQEQQRLTQNYQKDTSKMDKDIKFAHQQFKHNRSNCESLKSHISVLQQHQSSLHKKQEDVNVKWKVKRADLSRAVDQYESTWQTYQAKYEESELAIQLLDLESQVTLVNNKIVDAQQTVEQLKHSIMKLQEFDMDGNQTFESLNAWIVKLAEVRHATKECEIQVQNKQMDFGKLQGQGQDLKEQEKLLHQQLDQIQAAKEERDRLEKERLEAEKRQEEEERQRHAQISPQQVQDKAHDGTYRKSTPITSSNNPIQQDPSASNTSTPFQTSQVISSQVNPRNAAPSQPTSQLRKQLPFIQMPVLSSSTAPQAKSATSLGVDKGAKPSTAPHFTLQIPVLPQHMLTSQASAASSQSLTPTASQSGTAHQLLAPHCSPTQGSIAWSTQPKSGGNRSPAQPQHNTSVVTTASPAASNPSEPSSGNNGLSELSSTELQRGDGSMGPSGNEICQQHQQQQQQETTNGTMMATDQTIPFELPPALQDGTNDNPKTPSGSTTPGRGGSSTPGSVFNFDAHMQTVEEIKHKSPGFTFSSRPMFSSGDTDQINQNEPEAMEANTGPSSFQETRFFTSIFSEQNNFSQRSLSVGTNSPGPSQIFASPKASSASPKTADKGNTENRETSHSFGGDAGGFMRMSFNNPSDMFAMTSNPLQTSNSGRGALDLFGGSGGGDERCDSEMSGGARSPAGFSFNFGGTDSPNANNSTSQPFSLF